MEDCEILPNKEWNNISLLEWYVKKLRIQISTQKKDIQTT